MLKKIPADYFDSSKGTLKLLWEDEWRALGITQVRKKSRQYHSNSSAGTFPMPTLPPSPQKHQYDIQKLQSLIVELRMQEGPYD
ncbi:G-protein complex alpha subunit GpaA/FadA [Aspergillus luchuensis]|uniref:G-protein complex alpha subunit GpaA/FadA n=1 Tax=Aspergillus kawachii TaxID=1069201 RepID=A0A146FT45_ASPKA|nr:G-protein complex alpha subunit GpaA/FadA [Aspergillus luchuensis]